MRKRVTVFIFILICVFLCVTTVTMAIMPTGINGFFEKPYEIYVCCYQTSNAIYTKQSRIFGKDAAEYSFVFSKFEDAATQKMLNIFLGGKDLERVKPKYIGREPQKVNKNLEKNNKKTIIFYYGSPQKFCLNNKKINYSYLFFEISNTNTFQTINLGLATEESFNLSNNAFSYNYYYEAEFNFFGLYNYLENVL